MSVSAKPLSFGDIYHGEYGRDCNTLFSKLLFHLNKCLEDIYFQKGLWHGMKTQNNSGLNKIELYFTNMKEPQR